MVGVDIAGQAQRFGSLSLAERSLPVRSDTP
jgi:hypothetical protein